WVVLSLAFALRYYAYVEGDESTNSSRKRSAKYAHRSFMVWDGVTKKKGITCEIATGMSIYLQISFSFHESLAPMEYWNKLNRY
ncbi:hypothetical protein IFM89_030495, partial [Coptis chinensis]